MAALCLKVNLISLFLYITYKSIQQTTDEYYEMLKNIFIHLVRYCMVTYMKDEKVAQN